MGISTLIDSKIFIAIVSSLSGFIVAIITQYLLNKRGLFTYYVFNNRVGLSAEDAIYGSVKVTWNGKPVYLLYLSTIELTNQSMKDFESVVMRVFTNNTMLLSEKTEIVGTTRQIDYAEDYKKEIIVAEGSKPTDAQFDLFGRRRDYIVPTMNRGQMLRFQFLNAAHSDEEPAICLDVLHKGVKCKFKIVKNQIFGVPQPYAALVGTFVGLIVVVFVIIYVKSLIFAALLSFFIGWLVLVPGVFTIKVLRKIRDWVAG